MQKRAFGIEIEYWVVVQKHDRSVVTEIVVESSNGRQTFAPSVFLKSVFPFQESAPPHLKNLLVYPPKQGDYFWFGSNGARFYFDVEPARFPEYATPECTSIRGVICHSAAGDTVVGDLREEAKRQNLLAEKFEGAYKDLFIFKMNSYYSGGVASYSVGCHENYLTLNAFNTKRNGGERFGEFCDFMVPFLATRQIFDGAGGVIRDLAGVWRYVISQRVFFIERNSGAGTMGEGRGFINFRIKPNQCPPGFVRLHLHCGDSSMSGWGKYIAMGATHLVLRAIEEGDLQRWKYRAHRQHSVGDARLLSSDPTLKTAVRVLTGDSIQPLLSTHLQREYAEFVAKSIKHFSPEEQELFSAWTSMIEKLERDPLEAAEELDWVIKLNHLNERHAGNFSDPRTQFASTLYHDISERGIYNRLLSAGAVEPFASPGDIAFCRAHPPETRAEFRSRFIRTILDMPQSESRFLGWEAFSPYGGYEGSKVYISDPLARTSAEAEAMLARMQKEIMSGKSDPSEGLP